MYGWIHRQLERPHGWLAPLAAVAMNRSNRTLNLHMVGALDIASGERILEIGFGGGYALELMRHHEPTARLAGLDISEDMVARARRRLGSAVTLRCGGVEKMPFDDASFDSVCTANTLYFWPDVQDGLGEIRRVLRDAGRLVIGVNPPETLHRQGFLEQGRHVLEPAAIVEQLQKAGYREVQARRMPDPDEGTVLLVATRDVEASPQTD